MVCRADVCVCPRGHVELALLLLYDSAARSRVFLTLLASHDLITKKKSRARFGVSFETQKWGLFVPHLVGILLVCTSRVVTKRASPMKERCFCFVFASFWFWFGLPCLDACRQMDWHNVLARFEHTHPTDPPSPVLGRTRVCSGSRNPKCLTSLAAS